MNNTCNSLFFLEPTGIEFSLIKGHLATFLTDVFFKSIFLRCILFKFQQIRSPCSVLSSIHHTYIDFTYEYADALYMQFLSLLLKRLVLIQKHLCGFSLSLMQMGSEPCEQRPDEHFFQPLNQTVIVLQSYCHSAANSDFCFSMACCSDQWLMNSQHAS